MMSGSRTRGRRAVAWLLALALVSFAAPDAGAKTPKAPKAPKPEKKFTFADIGWYASKSVVLERLEEKGYRAIPGTRDMVVAQGRMFEHIAVARGMLDDSARVVRWEVTVLADSKGDRFQEMKPIYQQIVTECEGRHGSAWDVAEKYKFPYDKDDHREMDALKDGKAMIHAVWRGTRPEDRLTVEMDPDSNVRLTYTCPGWNAFQDRVRHRKARDL